MEQFKHLQLPASIKKHYVKLVAIGIILITLTIIILLNTDTISDTDYYDTPDSAEASRLA